MKGSDLKGKKYQPLFPYFNDLAEEGCFTVLNDSYVTTESGTGIVHIAPGFGEDDNRVMKEAGIKGMLAIRSMPHNGKKKTVEKYASSDVIYHSDLFHQISWVVT